MRSDDRSGKMPEKRSVGRALRKALGLEMVELEIESRKGGTSQLMNPRRLKIFRYLWSFPCSHVRQVSRATGMPVESLKWHLKMLEKSKLISSKKFERKVAYYPTGLVRPKDVELFAQISEPTRRAIIRLLWREPKGIKLELLASNLAMSKQALNHHLSILEKLSVIESTKRKKPTIYRLHGSMDGLMLLYQRRASKVLDWLRRVLDEDCLNPRITEKRDDRARFRLSFGVKKKMLQFFLDPFHHIYSKK